MTTLIIKVDDDRTESLKKILSEIPYVHETTLPILRCPAVSGINKSI